MSIQIKEKNLNEYNQLIENAKCLTRELIEVIEKINSFEIEFDFIQL